MWKNCTIFHIAFEKEISFPYVIIQMVKLRLMVKENAKLVEKEYVRETEF
jgi:hypothetical protein